MKYESASVLVKSSKIKMSFIGEIGYYL